MRRIGPHDKLEPHTPVQVKNRRGVVVRAEDRRDQHGSPIVTHVIRFTHKSKIQVANKTVWILLDKPVEQDVNYSFVNVLPHAGFQS